MLSQSMGLQRVKRRFVLSRNGLSLSFLRFAGFCRRLIKDFSKITKNFHALTQGGSRISKCPKTRSTHQEWSWMEVHQCAFNNLKCSSATAPVLAYGDCSNPFSFIILMQAKEAWELSCIRKRMVLIGWLLMPVVSCPAQRGTTQPTSWNCLHSIG